MVTSLQRLQGVDFCISWFLSWVVKIEVLPKMGLIIWFSGFWNDLFLACLVSYKELNSCVFCFLLLAEFYRQNKKWQVCLISWCSIPSLFVTLRCLASVLDRWASGLHFQSVNLRPLDWSVISFLTPCLSSLEPVTLKDHLVPLR